MPSIMLLVENDFLIVKVRSEITAIASVTLPEVKISASIYTQELSALSLISYTV